MAHTSRHSAQGIAESLENVSDQDETEMGADALGETQRIGVQMPSVASSAGFMPPVEDDVIAPIIEPTPNQRSAGETQRSHAEHGAHAGTGTQSIAAQTVTLFGRPFDRRVVIAVAAVIAAVLAVLVGWGVVANMQSHSGDARSLVSKVEPNADGKPMQNGGSPATGKSGEGMGSGSDASSGSDSVDFNQLSGNGTTVTDNGSGADASNGGNAGASTDSGNGNGASNGGANNGLGSGSDANTGNSGTDAGNATPSQPNGSNDSTVIGNGSGASASGNVGSSVGSANGGDNGMGGGSDANTDNSGTDAGNGNATPSQPSQPNESQQQGTHPESDSMNFGPIV